MRVWVRVSACVGVCLRVWVGAQKSRTRGSGFGIGAPGARFSNLALLEKVWKVLLGIAPKHRRVAILPLCQRANASVPDQEAGDSTGLNSRIGKQ